MAHNLDSCTLERLYKRMLRVAQIKKNPFPEEVAQEYVCRLLEGLHAKATVDQAYIDIERLTLGRKSQLGEEMYFTKFNLERKSLTKEGITPDSAEDLETSIDYRIQVKSFIGSIKDTRLQEIAYLRLVKGESLKDIGQVFGIGQARVQQIISRQLIPLMMKLHKE